MCGQQHCGMPAFDASSMYNRAMPAYNRWNVHCGEKRHNGSMFVLLVVLFILLIIVGSAFF